ncbi:sulfotransferase [Cohnella panacarvi]|uniref:sulfotransferase n=1 Tax=Cohnella panacarvi TaxID=400776 RepID=UPI00047E4517|nr:sulfotransferase [Cohnella panacarvi]
MDIIISAAVHRSGSTLLQRIVNSRKENLIWGEHQGVVTNFLDIYKQVRTYSLDYRKERNAYFGSDENPNVWTATMTPEFPFVEQGVVESVRAFLNALYSQYRDSHDTIGFKEVRYGEQELKLLRKCYPEAEFLLVVRNPIHTWQSLMNCRGWYKDDVRTTANKWNHNTGGYLALAGSDPKSHLIVYENLIRKDPATLDTVEACAKVPRQQILNVMSHKVGSTSNESISDEDRNVILEICGERMRQLGYLTSEGEEDRHEPSFGRLAVVQD